MSPVTSAAVHRHHPARRIRALVVVVLTTLSLAAMLLPSAPAAASTSPSVHRNWDMSTTTGTSASALVYRDALGAFNAKRTAVNYQKLRTAFGRGGVNRYGERRQFAAYLYLRGSSINDIAASELALVKQEAARLRRVSSAAVTTQAACARGRNDTVTNSFSSLPNPYRDYVHDSGTTTVHHISPCTVAGVARWWGIGTAVVCGALAFSSNWLAGGHDDGEVKYGLGIICAAISLGIQSITLQPLIDGGNGGVDVYVRRWDTTRTKFGGHGTVVRYRDTRIWAESQTG